MDIVFSNYGKGVIDQAKNQGILFHDYSENGNFFKTISLGSALNIGPLSSPTTSIQRKETIRKIFYADQWTTDILDFMTVFCKKIVEADKMLILSNARNIQ